MKCPFCSHIESKVTDSRLSTVGDVTRRRRECESCARRFTTYERVEEVLPLVVKKDGRREMFDRQKLLGGLRRACEKRAIALERIEAIVDAIERELIDSGDKEISANVVGEKVMLARITMKKGAVDQIFISMIPLSATAGSPSQL